MEDQEPCASPVIVRFPAQINAANAEQAAGQITASFTPGVDVVIADLTATTCRDGSAIRHLLKAHRKAAVRGRQVRFAIRPSEPMHRITDSADIHPLLAVYPTLQNAITGRSPKPRQRLQLGLRHALPRERAEGRRGGLVNGRRDRR